MRGRIPVSAQWTSKEKRWRKWMSEREGVQGGSETSHGVRVGDGGTDENSGGGD